MTNDKSKVMPKVCAKCGASLEVDESKETIDCPFCRASYNVSELLNESDEVKIEKIKSQTYKDIETQKLKHEQEKEERQEKKENLENFKKSKLKKWLVPCAIISGMCTLVSFSDGDILAGFIALIQMVAYIVALLMGYQVIKEKIKYMRVLVAAVGFVLIIPFFGTFGSDSSRSNVSNGSRISMDEPIEMSTIEWPNSEMAKLLPKPKSKQGKIVIDSSDSLDLYIGDTLESDYKDYVKACEEKGFNVDYTKYENSYIAKNKDGYDLYLSYEENEVMEIRINAPQKESEEKIEEDEKDKTEEDNSKEDKETDKTDDKKESKKAEKKESSGGVDPEFKEAMDSYEEFFDEYIAFMEKYSSSSNTISMMSDYAKYMTKYSETMEKMDKINEDELSAADQAYYIKVSARINKKLAEASY